MRQPKGVVLFHTVVTLTSLGGWLVYLAINPGTRFMFKSKFKGTILQVLLAVVIAFWSAVAISKVTP